MAVRASLDDTTFRVRLTGAARVFGCRSSLEIHRDAIRSVTQEDWATAVRRIGWRLCGTYVPRSFAAGRFTVRGRRGERAWCWFRRSDPVVVIETTGHRPSLVLVGRSHLGESIAQALTGSVTPEP